jgi:hypothetical protein
VPPGQPHPEELAPASVSKDGPRHDCCRDSTFSRHGCVRVMLSESPSENRGRRECRVRVAPVAACAVKKHRRQQLQVHRNNRHSLRDGFNGVLRALPGDRAFLPPSLARRRMRLCELSASVGAPEPHDFSVRVTLAFVLRNSRVHRIPLPTSVTTAKRPSFRVRDTADDRSDLGSMAIPVGMRQVGTTGNLRMGACTRLSRPSAMLEMSFRGARNLRSQ